MIIPKAGQQSKLTTPHLEIRYFDVGQNIGLTLAQLKFPVALKYINIALLFLGGGQTRPPAPVHSFFYKKLAIRNRGLKWQKN